MTSTAKTAPRAYSEKMGEVYAILESLPGRIADAGIDAREANWAHVGDAARLLAMLREIEATFCASEAAQ